MPLTEDEYDEFLDEVPEAPVIFEAANSAPTGDVLQKLDKIHGIAKLVLDDYGGRPPLAENTGEQLLVFLGLAEELSNEVSEIENACSLIRTLLDKYVHSAPNSLYDDDL